MEPLEERTLLSGFVELAKLIASDAAAGDRFGISVAVSGDTVVVGALLDDDAGESSGSAYVFTQSGTSWTQEAKLTASDAAAGDRFGESIAISGDTVVVGARGNDDAGESSGSAYVFIRSGTSWTQEAKLTASDAAIDDLFGFSVAVSGDTAVVGALFDNDAGTASGSAYVFTRSGTNWTQEAKLTASDAAAGDRFGESIAISGDTVVVGADFDDDGGSDSGSAYVFTRSGTDWTQRAKLTASDATAFDNFGVSVAVSDDTVVVGAYLEGDVFTHSGSAYVFEEPATGWADANEDAKLTASDGRTSDLFGESVAVSGDTIVVGVAFDDDAGSSSGSARVFNKPVTGWADANEDAKLTASDAGRDDRFGGAVAISGDTVVAGAHLDVDAGIQAGSAYVFVPDVVAPETTIDSATDGDEIPLPNGGSTFSESINLDFSGTDNGSVAGFECSLDGGAFVACTPLQTFADLSVGSHTVEVRAVDAAGNTDPTPAGFSWTILPPQPVAIDIKPGSFPNSINLGSNGNVPVAILSTTEFDATTIDPLTVTLAEAQVRVRGNGTPMASEQDVDGDGLLDLVVHVDTEGLELTEADTQAYLVGETFGGVVVEGSDAIRVVAALHVAGVPSEGLIAGDVLTRGALDSAVEQSVAHWASVGVDPSRLDALTQVDVQITDLPGSLLGVAALNIVWIDRDAAGYGWSRGSGGVDLVSAVTHEFGHVLGLDHDNDQHGVMGETLSSRMPDPLGALFAPPLADHAAVFDEIGSALDKDDRLAGAELAEVLAVDVTSTADSTGRHQREARPRSVDMGSNALVDLHFTEFDPTRVDDDLCDELMMALAR